MKFDLVFPVQLGTLKLLAQKDNPEGKHYTLISATLLYGLLANQKLSSPYYLFKKVKTKQKKIEL